MLDWKQIDIVIDFALREDMPEGDITTESVISPGMRAEAVIRAKAGGVPAGIPIAERVFRKIDPDVVFKALAEDGTEAVPGQKLAELRGPASALLKGERTALNFLQRMSGIATLTRKYVQALVGSRTRLLDTRKTTPGLRALEKYAVRMGGGTNHRMSLSDMVMLKDNHLRMAGSIPNAVARARAGVGPEVKIEVEAAGIEEVAAALEAGADWIMLDNMSPEQIRQAVSLVDGRVPLEISGNVRLEKLAELGALGVDFISVGRLTHSFESLDISMDFL
jgi:nicotinate-nucleotide pyrophosphorylase (carboxylating)